MKQLFIIRHAKSSWDYEVNDQDRPLSARGIRDAHLVSMHVKQQLASVDAVFSSPANRALHTAIIFLKNTDIPFNQLTVTNNLYDFSGQMVTSFLNSLSDTLQTVMIFGHNHALTSVVNILGNEYIENVTTCGFVHIQFESSSWKTINNGTTQSVIFPKHLKK